MDYGRVWREVLAHEDSITCVSYGIKSRLLLTGSNDCSVKVWRGVNADRKDIIIECLYKHLDHSSAVRCMCFDLDDLHFAVGTEDGEIYIWQTSDFTVNKKYANTTDRINALVYSPDGQKIAVGTDNGGFHVLEVATGMSVFSKTLESGVYSLRWQGNLLAIGCESGVLSLWDMFEVRVLLEIRAHAGAIHSADISTDRRLIATGSQDKSIKVWCAKPDARDFTPHQ